MRYWDRPPADGLVAGSLNSSSWNAGMTTALTRMSLATDSPIRSMLNEL